LRRNIRIHQDASRQFIAQQRAITMPKLTPHEALIFLMITMSAVDRQISDHELERISQIVRQLPVFMGFDFDSLPAAAVRCGELLGKEDGLDELLEMAEASLPKKLYETAYALAVEVAAADLKVPDEEIRLLELLRDQFHLDKLVTAAIERSARARHQTI
jgi:tellurite resistance protein